MAYGTIIEVVNRVETPLTYVKDGRDYNLLPGSNHIPSTHLRYAKAQNIVMGSANPNNPQEFVSLVGVKHPNKKGKQDACGPLTLREAKACIESIDRSKVSGPGRKAIIEAANVIVSRYEVAATNPNISDAGFSSSLAGE